MKRLAWIGLILAGMVSAQEAAEVEDWELLRAQAKELRDKAAGLQTEAQRQFEVTNKACWEKFLVSSCQEDAKQAQRETNKEAQRINMEALTIERKVAAHDREVRLVKKAERLLERDQKAAERAKQIRIEDEANRLRMEQKLQKANGG